MQCLQFLVLHIEQTHRFITLCIYAQPNIQTNIFTFTTWQRKSNVYDAWMVGRGKRTKRRWNERFKEGNMESADEKRNSDRRKRGRKSDQKVKRMNGR